MKKPVIFFNHWFSAIYHHIQYLKKEGYTIVYSSINKNSPCKWICDRFVHEPEELKGKDYIEWLQNVITENKVDVFFPKRNMQLIAEHKGDLSCDVVCESADILSVVENKDLVYRRLANIPLVCNYIPKTKVVTNIEGFDRAYAEVFQYMLQEGYENPRVCIKYVEDEGARSFRVIDNRVTLDNVQGSKMTYDSIYEYIQKQGEIRPLMLMPYLSGREISIDCIPQKTRQTIMATRVKREGRIKEICTVSEVLREVVLQIEQHFGLTCPYNVQFKQTDTGEWKLLEINTRLAGGSHLLAEFGVRPLLLYLEELPYILKEGSATHIEKPIILEEKTGLVVYATDLDRTLIHREGDVVVEKLNDIPISYMCRASLYLWNSLTEDGKAICIPATTRSISETKRIEMLRYNEWVICANGGVILHNGERLDNWCKHLEVKLAAQYDELLACVHNAVKNNDWNMSRELRVVDGVYYFCMLKEENVDYMRFVADLPEYIQEEYNVYIQRKKIYIVPKEVDKVTALKYIVEQLDSKPSTIITSGDGRMDLKLLEYGDIAFAPEGSEVLEYLSREVALVPPGIHGTGEMLVEIYSLIG